AFNGEGMGRREGERVEGNPAGRWPANVVLSSEAAAALDEQSGERASGYMKPTHTNAERAVYGQNADGGYVTMETYGDTGGASRFFLTVQPDMLCGLCGLPYAPIAANPSSRSESQTATALDVALGKLPPESGGSGSASGSPATTAGVSSRTTRATEASTPTVPPSADMQLAEWIVRLAKSAGGPCDSCGTDIAQSVALWLRGQTLAS